MARDLARRLRARACIRRSCRATSPRGRRWCGSALSEFDYVARRPHPSYPITGEETDYWIKAVELPSVGENGQPGNLVTARYYEGKRSGEKPLVIVLPIWGIHDYPSNDHLCRLAGAQRRRDQRPADPGRAAAVRLAGDRGAGNEAAFFGRLDRMVDRFVATVIDVRRLVDWAQSQPEVDPDRIALVGFSMSALVASVDDRATSRGSPPASWSWAAPICTRSWPPATARSRTRASASSRGSAGRSTASSASWSRRWPGSTRPASPAWSIRAAC